MNRQLDSLTTAALASSSGPNVNARYEPLTEPVCDGFELRFGNVLQSEAVKMKAQIINLLHREQPSLTIKNVLFKTVQRELRAWITLTESTRKLSRTLIEELIRVQ